ncbi:thermonuclease family protein [Pseudomonas tolaasii]|uniref:thermonuclease family protein n=1 Tax=Pseudomonas tolaasii TaxID=29442 RepID=UPI001C52EAB9|nr:thermonuclease family protein [Pseudomonas tolaasii]
MAYQKKVKVLDKGSDRYDRQIGALRLDGLDLNAAKVSQGIAWIYTSTILIRDYLACSSKRGMHNWSYGLVRTLARLGTTN